MLFLVFCLEYTYFRSKNGVREYFSTYSISRQKWLGRLRRGYGTPVGVPVGGRSGIDRAQFVRISRELFCDFSAEHAT